MRIVLNEHAVHRIFASSLAPLGRAIGASLGPNGKPALHDLGTEKIGRARSGIEIALAMPMREGPSGVAPRMLKELLFAANRDLGDGTAQLALVAIAAFTRAARLVAAGISAVALADALHALRPVVSQFLQAERCDTVNLMGLAQTAGAEAPLAQHLASLFAEMALRIAALKCGKTSTSPE